MSGRQPFAVTKIDEDNLTNWRQHLAMILSNHKSDINQSVFNRSVNALGDALWNKHMLFASQFCYILASAHKVNFLKLSFFIFTNLIK